MAICLERGANDLQYGPADATATASSLAPVKSRMVLPFWCWLQHHTSPHNKIQFIKFLTEHMKADDNATVKITEHTK